MLLKETNSINRYSDDISLPSNILQWIYQLDQAVYTPSLPHPQKLMLLFSPNDYYHSILIRQPLPQSWSNPMITWPDYLTRLLDPITWAASTNISDRRYHFHFYFHFRFQLCNSSVNKINRNEWYLGRREVAVSRLNPSVADDQENLYDWLNWFGMRDKNAVQYIQPA